MEIFFSIVLPTYNRPAILVDMIKCVQLQSFENWELVIVDDSSTSQENLIKDINDSRLQYYNRGKKLGVSSARNEGAKLAKGKYVIFLDDDDKVTDSWLQDFATLAIVNEYPEVLYCGMEVIDALKKSNRRYYPSKELWQLVIPGGWVINTSLFLSLCGYDERLSYGENTELFFRIRAIHPRQALTDSINFIYYPSVDGGSKNIKNKIDSTLIILDKHRDYLDKNVRKLFIQMVGVCYLRLHRFKEARECLTKAYLIDPYNIKTLIRLMISFSPFISKIIYRPA